MEAARPRVRELVHAKDELERRAAEQPAPPSFLEALKSPDVAVIAEVKRRSPSKGAIREGLSAGDQAMAYQRGGAAAISVLTEPEYFGGAPEDLMAVRTAVAVPVLKKDFHLDPVQVLEARALGASAALLIARALPPEALDAMLRAGARWGVEMVVEVRDEDELRRALDGGASLVGVNNRNLESLAIDMNTSARLLPRIPQSVIAIAESGITTRDDVLRFAAAGADAVLVGSSVSAADDPEGAVRALVGVRRRQRAG